MNIEAQKKSELKAAEKEGADETSGMTKETGIIQKDRLAGMLKDLSKAYSLFIPHDKNGMNSFRKLDSVNTIKTDYLNSFIPPGKLFCFNPVWKKFTDFDVDDMNIDRNEKALLFGVRPCDAHSLGLLDKAIKDNEFYEGRRKNTLLVVNGCNKPSRNCFCTSVNGSPFSSEEADIFLTDMGSYYVAENISGRIQNFHKYFSCVEGDVLKEKGKVVEKSRRLLPARIDMKKLPGMLEEIDKMDESGGKSVWEELAGKCTNCGVCISLCPTCHCCLIVEDVMDLVVDELGEEANTFDPCMVNIFMSNGLQGPTPSGTERLHRRVMDKFYHSAKNLGQPFCVGCGRCVTHCPENINFKNIVEQLTSGMLVRHD